jgi:Tfp pilus assembly protein PilF
VLGFSTLFIIFMLLPLGGCTKEQEAEEKVPNEPLIKYHLGMAYLKNENRELAKKTLAEALKLRSDFFGAEEARVTLQNISK